MVVIGDDDTTVRAIDITLFPELLLVVTSEKGLVFYLQCVMKKNKGDLI